MLIDRFEQSELEFDIAQFICDISLIANLKCCHTNSMTQMMRQVV